MELFVLALQFGLAGVLAVAAVGKLRDLSGSRNAVNDFGVPQRYADPLGTLLPFGELLLAIGLLVGATARLAAFGALALFLAFIAGIAWNLRQGKHPDCHCFGEFHSSPAGWQTIARNAVFAVMAAIVVAAGGQGIRETYGDLSSAGQVGLWLAILIGAIGTGQGWFLSRSLKNQQKIEADLEALRTEMIFARYEAAVPAPAGVEPPAVAEEPVGEPAPALDLPTLDGERLTLETLRAEGKPGLLLFTAPDCGYCSVMYPEVEEWSRRFGNDLTVAVIGRGEIEANRDKFAEFDFPIAAVDVNGEASNAWDAVATPTGFVVLANGTIADEPARGRQEIQKLVGRTLQRRTQQRSAPIVPETAAMTVAVEPAVESWPAPSFELPAVDGSTLSLEGLLASGKPVLAIFWGVHCGFCERFGPEVGEWIRRFGDDVTFAFLSSGTSEDNRHHIERFGLVNVGLQQFNEVMHSFGGNGTPSAVLIRPDGFIYDDVVGGAPLIRRLLDVAISGNRGVPRTTPSSEVDPKDPTTRGYDGHVGAPTQEDLIRLFLQSTAGKTEPTVGTSGTRLPWAGLDGAFVGIDDYWGDDLVLVFWGVDCAFSQRMLLDLKEWELGAGQTTKRVLIISSGEAAANRAQGLRSRIVLDDSFSAGNSFGVTGTPAAIRLDAEGRVASDLAEGADAVLDLLYDFSESRAPLPAR